MADVLLAEEQNSGGEEAARGCIIRGDGPSVAELAARENMPPVERLRRELESLKAAQETERRWRLQRLESERSDLVKEKRRLLARLGEIDTRLGQIKAELET